MAGAAHTLPVVIQYALYNSTEQQAPSLKQHTQTHMETHKHVRPCAHTGSKHIESTQTCTCLHGNMGLFLLLLLLLCLETIFFIAHAILDALVPAIQLQDPSKLLRYLDQSARQLAR